MKAGFLIISGGLWFALLGGGSALLARYESTAGPAGPAPAEWPEASPLRRAPGMATLVMVAHPQCPCTRASIEELAALLAEGAGRVTAHVVFLQPENGGADWTQGASWQAAAALPGVTVSADAAGAEAGRFGGETSGDVLLYDARGRLIFHGGITAARGRAGANAGRSTLTDLLAGHPTLRTRTPVFGCPLTTPVP